MSSWSEAVWVVKKLQKNFDFQQDIKLYTQDLNDLNRRVNTLNDTVATDEAALANLKTELTNRVVTIRDTVGNDGLPSNVSSDNYGKGAVWFIVNRI